MKKFLMLAALATLMVLLLPAPISLVVLAIHIVCILAKAVDEESYLRTVHGEEYGDYLSRSGRFLPKLRAKPRS